MLKARFIGEVVGGKEGLLGSEVRVCGWLHVVRDLGRIKFLVLRDRTGSIQCVVKRGESREELLELAEGLREESVLCVRGVLREAPTREGVELRAESIDVLSAPVEPLPLEVRDSVKAGLPTRLRYRWIDVRNPAVGPIFEVKSWVARVFREYYASQGFIEIFTPKIVASGTESGAEVFPVIYFNREAFLAQSPQFYKQFAVIAGLERVFEVGPVFRAEPHHTPRHLNEYHSLDIELGFIESHHDVIDYVEGFFRSLSKLSEEDPRVSSIMESFGAEPPAIPASGIPRMSIREVYRVLEEEYGKEVPEGGDLDPEAERLISVHVKENYDSDLVFVVDYPWRIRPFYAMREDSDPEYTRSFDLIMRGLEVVTGGQREHRYDRLVENAREKGVRVEDVQFYLDFFKHGAPPHGGAGMGLERIVMQLLNIKNIREARLLPRDTERVTP